MSLKTKVTGISSLEKTGPNMSAAALLCTCGQVTVSWGGGDTDRQDMKLWKRMSVMFKEQVGGNLLMSGVCSRLHDHCWKGQHVAGDCCTPWLNDEAAPSADSDVSVRKTLGTAFVEALNVTVQQPVSRSALGSLCCEHDRNIPNLVFLLF